MINRILLLIGAVQGWALYGLWKAHELKVWPASDLVSERVLLYLSLALPLAWYLTENIASLGKRRRVWILVCIGVLFALLGAYSAWAEMPRPDGDSLWQTLPMQPADVIAAAILGFALIPL
jgi:drug/metabolite transporter (DMT)-like permease